MIFVKRILVAEDEDVIRDFVVINLRRNGYEVVDVPVSYTHLTLPTNSRV